ncbi:MAG: glycosyltransferase family 2 protein [bacterium]
MMNNENDIYVSIVIPSRNRPHLLRRCLESIYSQNNAPPFEVIVIDDCSVGYETRRIARYFGAKFKRLPKRMGQAFARNIGVVRSKGYIVAFIDDDCVASENWLFYGTLQFENGVVGGVEGMTVPHPNEKPTPFSNYIDNRRGGHYTTCNIFYRRDILLNSGGFDITYNEPFFHQLFREDSDLAYKVLSKGFVIPFVSECLVYHLKTDDDYLKPLKDAVKHYLDPKLAKKNPILFKKSGFRALARGHYPYYIGLMLIIYSLLAQRPLFILFGIMGILISSFYSTIKRCRGKQVRLYHPFIIFIYELFIPLVRVFGVIMGCFRYGKIII